MNGVICFAKTFFSKAIPAEVSSVPAPVSRPQLPGTVGVGNAFQFSPSPRAAHPGRRSLDDLRHSVSRRSLSPFLDSKTNFRSTAAKQPFVSSERRFRSPSFVHVATRRLRSVAHRQRTSPQPILTARMGRLIG
jgi:hypothetical protein